jgi:hypothetical protein
MILYSLLEWGAAVLRPYTGTRALFRPRDNFLHRRARPFEDQGKRAVPLQGSARACVGSSRIAQRHYCVDGA